MAIPTMKVMTSIDAIAASIRTDNFIYRWFLHLIVQPRVKAQLNKQKQFEQTYAQLKKNVHCQIITNSILLLVFISFLAFKDFYWIVPFLFTFFLNLKYLFRRKDLVVELSLGLLNLDYTRDDIGHMTLYQICEIYARKYKIPSLVDTIYALDRVFRRTLIWMAVGTCLIYPIYFWHAVGWILAMFFGIRLIIQSTYFYRQIN